MKVVIISDYPLETPYGGLQTHVYHLTKHLSQCKNIEIHVITFSDRNRTFKKDELIIHQISRTDIVPQVFTILTDSLKIKKKIHELNPDVVHIHGTHYPYNLIAGMIATDYHTILTVHGLMGIEYKFNSGLNYLGGVISFILEKYAFKKVKDIIVCSKPMYAEVEKLTKANIYLIPNGVELNEINRIKRLNNIKHPSILYMGLLENIKGVDVLIKATAMIKMEIPNITVYIAGEGSEEDHLIQLSKDLDLDENVKFLGYLGEENKYSYLKSVDICVLPSRYESFGIIILEAMVCNTPIIASDVGNIPFLIQDPKSGLTVKTEDVDDFAKKTLQLLEDDNLKEEIVINAKLKVREYSWQKIALETAKTYRKIGETNEKNNNT